MIIWFALEIAILFGHQDVRRRESFEIQKRAHENTMHTNIHNKNNGQKEICMCDSSGSGSDGDAMCSMFLYNTLL